MAHRRYTGADMAEGGAYDVVLFGFRNDLARARALEHLDALPSSQGVPIQYQPDSAAPQRLFLGLDEQSARALCAELADLGAQVKIVAAGAPLTDDAEPSPSVPPRPRSSAQPLTLLLVMVLGIALGLWRAGELQIAFLSPPRPALAPVVLAPQSSAYAPTDEGVPHEEPAALRANAEALELASAQQFQEAVNRLEVAMDLAPDQPVITRNLQTVLLNWGVSELNAGKLDTAVDHLLQAARLGERSEVLTVLGATYLRQEDYVHAQDVLQRALALDATNKEALLGLGQIALKQDRRAEAFDFLQHAKEAGAAGPELDDLLAHLGREVDAEWNFTQRESRHFRLSFADEEDRNVVRSVLDVLEKAYEAVGEKFEFYPDEKNAVVLYTQQNFHSVTQTPDWAGAAFDGRIKLPVGGVDPEDPGFLAIVRHEYAHRVIAQLSNGHCPVWLNEGLAVWAEESRDGERRRWARTRIADQRLFRLADLNSSFATLPAARAEVAYAESYLAVHALIDEYGAHRIPGLLDALGRTHNLREAFAAVYPGDLASFERQLLGELTGQG